MLRRYWGKDYADMASWYKKRGLSPIPSKFLPKIGFIDEGIACGFLLKTEVPIASFEFYITNPDVSGRVRKVALDNITQNLLVIAKDQGVHLVRCDTTKQSIEARAKEFGFKHSGLLSFWVKEI